MKYWIVKDANDVLHVVGAKGFIPNGAVCEAPEGEDVEWLVVQDKLQIWKFPEIDADGNNVTTNGDQLFYTEDVLDENGDVLHLKDDPILDENGNPTYAQIPVMIEQQTVIGLEAVVDDAKKAQVLAERQALADAAELLKYRQQRAQEYPTVGDQLDALYKKLHLNDSTDWDGIVATIEAVKVKYPKPE